MRKRLLTVLMATVMTVGLLAGCGSKSTSEESAATESTETTEASSDTQEADASAFDDLKATYGDDVFEANAAYDEYTIIEYTIEDAGATFAATVSRKADKSEYYIQCMFYGDEQVVVVKNGEVTEDKTGFMQTDGPLIVEAAESEGTWVAIQ